MSIRVFAGVDQGTTSTFTGLYDETGAQVASARRRSVTMHPQSGWDEQDGAQLLRDIKDSVAEALSLVEGGAELVGVGLANQGESVIAFDRVSGAPLSPAILWSDRRSSSIVAEMCESGAGPLLEERTGLGLDPYYSAGKLAWMLRHLPEVKQAQADGRLLLGTLDTYFTYNLSSCRVFLTDPSTASRTQLMNLDDLTFDAECAESFGIDPDLLAAVMPTVLETPVETVLGAPLYASSSDTQASLAALGGVNIGDLKVTYGTGCFINANGGPKPLRAPEGLMPTYGWSIGDERAWLLEGGVFSAATAIDWLVSIGLATSAPHVSELAAAAAGGAPDTLFLPSFTGVGAPWWRSGAAGLLSGLRTSTTPGDIAHAVLEGIAQRVTDVVEAMSDAIESPDAIRVDGGLTASASLIQLQADLTGRPVLCALEKDSTSAGVAGYAAIGAGELDLTALAERASFADPVLPGRGEDWREQRRAQWRQFVDATAALDPDKLATAAGNR